MSGSSVDQGLIVRPDNHSLIKGVDDALALAKHLLKSNMLPTAIRTPEAALVIILTARELGIGPMMGFQKINVIQGKPTIAPELMLALARRQGLLEDMKIENDGTKCAVTIKRKGNSAATVTFSLADAEAQGLAGKDNWRRMPAIMLQWRAVSAACRIVFPDVIGGLYTPEELGADVDESGEVIEGQVTEITTPGKSPEEQKTEVKKPSAMFPESIDKTPLSGTSGKVDKTTQNTVAVNKWQIEIIETVVNMIEAKHDKEAINILNASPLKPGCTIQEVVRYTNLYLKYRWENFVERKSRALPAQATKEATEEYLKAELPK